MYPESEANRRRDSFPPGLPAPWVQLHAGPGLHKASDGIMRVGEYL